MEERRDKRGFKRRRPDKMSEDIIIKMKEMMLNDPVIMKEMEKLMTDGLSQDEALGVLICAWASSKGILEG